MELLPSPGRRSLLVGPRGFLGLGRGRLWPSLPFASTSDGAGIIPRMTTGMTWPPAQPFEQVLARARRMDAVAISQLYSRFLPVVYRFMLARVGDVHTAEDLTSETFFAMLAQIATTRAQDELGFSAWLLGIARNKALMFYRSKRSAPTFTRALDDDAHPSAVAEEDDPLEVLTARERWSDVVAALNRLTEEQRTVVLYRCVLGYSAEEVGGLMGKTAGTVRALQFRALASLARQLGLGRSSPTSGRASARTSHASDRASDRTANRPSARGSLDRQRRARGKGGA